MQCDVRQHVDEFLKHLKLYIYLYVIYICVYIMHLL